MSAYLCRGCTLTFDSGPDAREHIERTGHVLTEDYRPDEAQSLQSLGHATASEPEGDALPEDAYRAITATLSRLTIPEEEQ